MRRALSQLSSTAPFRRLSFTTSPSASPLSKKPKPDDMRKTILRRLDALETANRAREEKVLSSIRGARVYVWIIVFAYYLGDLRSR